MKKRAVVTMRIPERKFKHSSVRYLGVQPQQHRVRKPKLPKYLRNKPSLTGTYVPWKLRKRQSYEDDFELAVQPNFKELIQALSQNNGKSNKGVDRAIRDLSKFRDGSQASINNNQQVVWGNQQKKNKRKDKVHIILQDDHGMDTTIASTSGNTDPGVGGPKVPTGTKTYPKAKPDDRVYSNVRAGNQYAVLMDEDSEEDEDEDEDDHPPVQKSDHLKNVEQHSADPEVSGIKKRNLVPTERFRKNFKIEEQSMEPVPFDLEKTAVPAVVPHQIPYDKDDELVKQKAYKPIPAKTLNTYGKVPPLHEADRPISGIKKYDLKHKEHFATIHTEADDNIDDDHGWSNYNGYLYGDFDHPPRTSFNEYMSGRNNNFTEDMKYKSDETLMSKQQPIKETSMPQAPEEPKEEVKEENMPEAEPMPEPTPEPTPQAEPIPQAESNEFLALPPSENVVEEKALLFNLPIPPTSHSNRPMGNPEPARARKQEDAKTYSKEKMRAEKKESKKFQKEFEQKQARDKKKWEARQQQNMDETKEETKETEEEAKKKAEEEAKAKKKAEGQERRKRQQRRIKKSKEPLDLEKDYFKFKPARKPRFANDTERFEWELDELKRKHKHYRKIIRREVSNPSSNNETDMGFQSGRDWFLRYYKQEKKELEKKLRKAKERR